MMTVEKLHNPETAAVDVEMNVSFFKVRSYRFPKFYFRMHFFNGTPGSVSNSEAVSLRRHKQEIQISVLSVGLYDHSSDFFITEHDAVCLAGINGVRDGFMRNDFTVFLEMVIPETEFLRGPVSEGFLIVFYKLFSVIISKRQKYTCVLQSNC